jgi:hypothetical protein
MQDVKTEEYLDHKDNGLETKSKERKLKAFVG